MKKNVKKLALSKVTLTNLSNEEMNARGAFGGLSNTCTAPTGCYGDQTSCYTLTLKPAICTVYCFPLP